MKGLNGPLRWGFFGAGKITSDFVKVLSSLPSTKHVPYAIAARDVQRAKSFALSHGISKFHSNYQQLAEDPNIDIVYVGTVNSEHYEQAKLAINHLKHVLVEKSICLNYKLCKELVDIAKRKGVFFMEGFWTVMFPATQKLYEQIKQGKIGDVVSVTLDVGHAGRIEVDRFRMREFGGGVLMNYGVYAIMLTYLLLGKPDAISASAVLSASDGVDETLAVSLKYQEKKCIANITMSIKATLSNEFRIAGTKGTIKLPFPFWAPTNCVTPEETFTYEYPHPESLKCATFNYPNAPGFTYEIEEVYDCITKGLQESEKLPWDASLGTLQITDEIRNQVGVRFPQD